MKHMAFRSSLKASSAATEIVLQSEAAILYAFNICMNQRLDTLHLFASLKV